eukprot:598913-Pleurochrysis_carterae.AAC.3
MIVDKRLASHFASWRAKALAFVAPCSFQRSSIFGRNYELGISPVAWFRVSYPVTCVEGTRRRRGKSRQ